MVDCLDEPRALAFVAGELAAELRQTIESHVDDCDSCRQVLAALVRDEARVDAVAWTPGRRVGRYVIRAPIGRGGMGSVFRADDLELDRAVALKRLHADADADARARLVREARSAAQLSHPNVVTVYEVGDDAGAPFLAMELVDGVTLTAWSRTPRSWTDVVAVLAQAGRGLAAAHERGLVHRDFKPDNVLIDRTTGDDVPRARVADFGLARASGDRTVLAVGSPGRLARVGRMTTTGALAGTPAYLAPELIDGGEPDARSDQYAFAVALFEAIHGEHPFAGDSAEAIWTEMAVGHIRAGRVAIPTWLDRAIRRGLAVDPAERWPSVAAMVAAIAPRRRRIWPYAAAATMFVGAAFAFSLWMMTDRSDECARGAGLIDALWNPAVRAAQIQRFTMTTPRGAGTIATTAALIDDWAVSWKFGRTAACTVAPQRRTARLDCLERDLASLHAQLNVWTTLDPETVDHAVAAASALPAPGDCGDHAVASTGSAQLFERIAELHALARAGRLRVANGKLAAVLAEAETSHDSATLSRALVTAGEIEGDLGDRDHAREHDARAAIEGARAGDDQTILAALLQEATLTTEAGHPQDALGLCDAADAVVARGKLDRADRVDVVRADALAKLGRSPEAIAAYGRVISVLEPRAARDRTIRIDLASAYGALGSALGGQLKLDEAAAALSRGLVIEEAELGPEHPEVGRTLHDLANQELELGKIDDAAAHYERTRKIFAAAYGDHHELVGSTDVALGNVALERGQNDAARAAFERARSELVGVLPADHPAFAAIEEGLGAADRGQDRDRESLPHYERAVAIQEKNSAGDALAVDLVNLAGALHYAGRDAESRTRVEQALAEEERAGVEPKGRVDAWQLLAELEWTAGHRVRAIELSRKVLATIGDDPRPAAVTMRKFEEATIAAWSAGHEVR